LRNQKVVLPKLPNAQFNELKNHETENRELDFVTNNKEKDKEKDKEDSEKE